MQQPPLVSSPVSPPHTGPAVPTGTVSSELGPPVGGKMVVPGGLASQDKDTGFLLLLRRAGLCGWTSHIGG